MNGADIEQGLHIITTKFRPLLDSTGRTVLAEASAEVAAGWKKYQAATRAKKAKRDAGPEWGYTISPQRPLRFCRVSVDGTMLQADVHCNIRWRDPDQLPVGSNLVIRVWSLDLELSHRPEYDAMDLREPIAAAGRRVMLRYHFDLADPNQAGPRFHMQVGGNAESEERCWLPKTLSIPRVGHHPMDLALACEIVALNFFRDDGIRVLEDPVMTSVVRGSERGLMLGYYSWCARMLRDGTESLLRMSMRPDMIQAVQAELTRL